MRRWRSSDRPGFAALNADPVVMEHYPRPLTAAESDHVIDRIEAHFDDLGWGLWAVEVRATGVFIGYVGLWPADHVAPGTVEVGWRLVARAWGHGYAPEVAAKVVRFGFEDLGLTEIPGFTVPRNVNSLRVKDEIGLRRARERDFDHPLVDQTRAAHLVRHVVYPLTADEWRRRGGTTASTGK